MTARRVATRPAAFSFKFLGTATIGSLAMALVSALAPLPVQIGALGAWLSVLAGLFLAYLEQEEDRERRRTELIHQLRVPIVLAPDHELSDRHRAISRALAELSRQPDPVLRRFSLLKLTSLAAEVQSLARGTIAFSATESWRSVYEELLTGMGRATYRSAAWVKSADYWQDRPGRRSMEINFAMARRGMAIERVVILRDDLWVHEKRRPIAPIHRWMRAQHEHGIRLSLVPESALESEPDLLADFGIYDGRAVGVHELDDRGRTLRFLLFFDARSLQLAAERWSRLSLYATSYAEALDRKLVAA